MSIRKVAVSGLGVVLAVTAALAPASPVVAKPVRISVDQPAEVPAEGR